MTREGTKHIMQNGSYFLSLSTLFVESVELHQMLLLGLKIKAYVHVQFIKLRRKISSISLSLFFS